MERIASLKASEPLATKESELTSFPFFLTYFEIKTTIELDWDLLI